MSGTQAAQIVVLAHAVFWAAVAARMWAGRQIRPSSESPRKPLRSRHMTSVLVFAGLAMGLFYVLLVLWWFFPERFGSPFVPVSPLVQSVAIGVLTLSLLLILWCFRVLRNWRLRAQIQAGDQLITNGPYAWVQHPIYSAMILFYLASALLIPYWWFVVQACLNAVAYDLRARAEETLLDRAFGKSYREYHRRTSRLIPWLY